jgi:hypothetical protein
MDLAVRLRSLGLGGNTASISLYERGERPSLVTAVMIERLTGGFVPCVSWVEAAGDQEAA